MSRRADGQTGRLDVRVSARVRAPLSTSSVARLAVAVVRAEQASVEALSITFVGPQRMRSLNRLHLGHDRVTDVIAFSLCPSARLPVCPSVVGDIYICPATAARAARRFGTGVKDELRRLVVHGVLHVLGYDHPEGDDRTDSPMWRRQERYLKAPAR